MFPPVFPVYIPALSPLHEFATLIWLAGVACLWLTRYTHQLGQRWGTFYYAMSIVVRPVGVLLIGVGWRGPYRLVRHPQFLSVIGRDDVLS